MSEISTFGFIHWRNGTLGDLGVRTENCPICVAGRQCKPSVIFTAYLFFLFKKILNGRDLARTLVLVSNSFPRL